MSEKTCAKCGLTKPTTDFPLCRKGIKEYVRGECRTCRKERRRVYHATNAERIAAKHAQWLDANRDSRAAQRRAYYEANKERILTQNRAYQKANRDWLTVCKLAWRVGLSPEEYLAFLDSRGNRCDICGNGPTSQRKRLSVDHDHACCPGHRSCGRCVRGLLCDDCNTALGRFGDDPDRLVAALAYLRRESAEMS